MFFYVVKTIPCYAGLAIGFMFLEGMLPGLQTIVNVEFIDQVTACFNGNGSMQAVYKTIIQIIGCLFLVNLLPCLHGMMLSVGKQKLNRKFRQEVVCKQNKLQYRYVEDAKCYELISRVSEGAEDKLMNGFASVLEFARLVITAFSILGILLHASLPASIVLISAAVPALWLAKKTGKQSYQMFGEEQEIRRRYQYLEHVLTDRETVEERTLFQITPVLTKEYDHLYQRSYEIEKKIQIKSFVNLKSGSVLTLFFAMLVIAVLMSSFVSGEITLGEMISLTTAVLNLVSSMSWELSDALFSLSEFHEYKKDCQAFMKLEEKKDAEVLPEERSKIKFQSLEFRDVSFRYPGTEKTILQNCSFYLEKGKHYAIVGENGTGKTTITKLILGLYEDYTGKILLNGKDIKEYSYGERKGLLAIVDQDFARYELTVRENLQLGDFKKEDEMAMWESLKNSGLKDYVDTLPNGLDTNLGRLTEKGTDLSGGQWQRLVIARALYADAQISILDEPTASMDPLEESRLYELFQTVQKNKFTLLITHRLGAAKLSDEILLMKDGRVMEKGNHDTLMLMENGIYRQMYEVQRCWYEDI